MSKRVDVRFRMDSKDKLELTIRLKLKGITLQKFFEDYALRFLKRERQKDQEEGKPPLV